MAYPPFDFTARRDITVNGVCGYRAGDGMYAQVVEDLGLVVGVDVDAARPDVFQRPADNAPRAAWIDYALVQDDTLTREEADDMTRAELAARIPDPAAEPKTPAKKSAAKSESAAKTSTPESGT